MIDHFEFDLIMTPVSFSETSENDRILILIDYDTNLCHDQSPF